MELTILCILSGVFAVLFIMYALYTIFKPGKNIHGQVALVTGGANGLGSAICKRLAAKGCKVAIADIDQATGLHTAEQIKKLYPFTKVAAFQCDVSNLESIQNLKLQVEKELGPVDILVNNAALLFEDPLPEVDSIYLTKMLHVNVLALFWTTRVFLPSMIERKRGHIVSLSSLAGLIGAPFMLMYGTTKFAVRGFMETLNLDLTAKRQNSFIKTTTVYPSFMDTNSAITNFFERSYKVNWLISSDTAACRIVKGIVYDENTVTLPSLLKYFGYSWTLPLWLRRFIIKYFSIKGFTQNKEQFEEMVEKERKNKVIGANFL